MDKMPCPDTFPDIISVRSFISKQFPTLLAIREIIADALFYHRKSYQHSALRDKCLLHASFTTICQYLNVKDGASREQSNMFELPRRSPFSHPLRCKDSKLNRYYKQFIEKLSEKACYVIVVSSYWYNTNC